MAADIELRNLFDQYVKKTNASLYGLASIIQKAVGLFAIVQTITELTTNNYTAYKFIFLIADANNAPAILVPGDLGIAVDNVNQFQDGAGNLFYLFQPGQVK